MPRHKTLRLAYVLPALHLSACLTSYVGEIFPKLEHLGIIFTFVLIADLPVSLVTYFAAWKYGLFAEIWTVVVGTLWWYVLGRAAEYIIEWIKDTRGNQNGSLFPPGKRS
jgi:uncharacterized membrane protein